MILNNGKLEIFLSKIRECKLSNFFEYFQYDKYDYTLVGHGVKAKDIPTSKYVLKATLAIEILEESVK